MSERDTAFLLQQWGLWIRQGDRVNLSVRSAMYNLIPEKSSSLPLANITDADALDVDRAIAQLRKSRPIMARVLWLEYACGYSTRRVSALINCSREEASKMCGRAFGLVDGILNPSAVFTLADLDELVKILDAA